MVINAFGVFLCFSKYALLFFIFNLFIISFYFHPTEYSTNHPGSFVAFSITSYIIFYFIIYFFSFRYYLFSFGFLFYFVGFVNSKIYRIKNVTKSIIGDIIDNSNCYKTTSDLFWKKNTYHEPQLPICKN